MIKTRLSKETMDQAEKLVYGCAAGTQAKMNHENCPAGEDTRERLSVKLSGDNRLILAHCFNCGGSGVRKGTLWMRCRHTIEVTDKNRDAFRRYDIIMEEWQRCPKTLDQDNIWPTKYFLDCWDKFREQEYFGIRYSNGGFYIIPRGNVPNDIIGFDTRPVAVKKYNRIINPHYEDTSKVLIYNKDASRTAVVCEDPISAMKISLAGYAGVSLCGTTLSQDDAFKLSILFDKVIVWLDNDKPDILAAANLIASRLDMLMDDVKIEIILKDPKKYTLTTLRDTIQRGFE